ncbi:hypothetical protein MCOR27_001345 [Pyricularia oryzae]|nr:hypothetical protein MCOR27_001345 [Pyricularia oryzae]
MNMDMDGQGTRVRDMVWRRQSWEGLFLVNKGVTIKLTWVGDHGRGAIGWSGKTRVGGGVEDTWKASELWMDQFGYFCEAGQNPSMSTKRKLYTRLARGHLLLPMQNSQRSGPEHRFKNPPGTQPIAAPGCAAPHRTCTSLSEAGDPALMGASTFAMEVSLSRRPATGEQGRPWIRQYQVRIVSLLGLVSSVASALSRVGSLAVARTLPLCLIYSIFFKPHFFRSNVVVPGGPKQHRAPIGLAGRVQPCVREVGLLRSPFQP